jgi:hypothetical protein
VHRALLPSGEMSPYQSIDGHSLHLTIIN